MKICRVALLVFLLAFPAAARADLDHLCLNQCIDNGGTASACLPHCAYGDSGAVKTEQSHKIFGSLTPINQNTILAPAKSAPPAPARDYACLARCLHGGAIYSLCENQCAKTPACQVGSPYCRDLTGMAPAAAALTNAQAAPPAVAPIIKNLSSLNQNR